MGGSFLRACRGVKFFFFLTVIAQATFRNKPEKEEWEGSCGTSWTLASKALQWCSVVRSLSRERHDEAHSPMRRL